MNAENETISLYVHIPFCEKKCFYCSFAVIVGQGHRVDEYLDALTVEAKEYRGAELKTIYIGGGTPTFMRDEQLEKLFLSIKNNFKFSSDIECSIEANPEGINFSKAQLLKSLGVNRVSLGVQSTQEKHLKFLGRNHDWSTALLAFRILRKAGFNNINLDLMYALPNQTMDEVEENVRRLLELKSEHMSTYSLTVEERSRFYVRQVPELDRGRQADHYFLICELLEKSGLKQYEISNFAQRGKESKHNIHYWSGGNYIGLGVGAHSHKNGRRSWNVSQFHQYLNLIRNGRSAIDGYEILDQEKRFMEKLLFRLRMNEGVDIQQLEEEFLVSISCDRQLVINQLIDDGFLTKSNAVVKTTQMGRLVLDELSVKLI